MYQFFYSYDDEVYGVLEHDEENSILKVELIRTNEQKEVNGEWFLQRIEEDKIDIAKDVENLNSFDPKILEKESS